MFCVFPSHLMMFNQTENQNRISLIIGYTEWFNNCHICETFGRSLSRAYLIEQLLCHLCCTGFTKVAQNCIIFWPKYSQKKNHIWISCDYAHVLITTISTAKFRKFLLSGLEEMRCFSSIFNVGQISMFKRACPSKQNFLWICTSTQYVLHIYKVSRNSVELFHKSCANKLFQ